MINIYIPKDTPVELDMSLVDEAYAVGKRRYQSNRDAGKRDLIKSRKPKLFLEGEGVCGEFAAASMLSAPPEEWDRIRTVQPRRSDEDSGDIKMRGYTIDVKTSQYDGAHLLIPLRRVSTLADVYILYTGSMGIYTFRGAVKKEHIRAQILSFDFKEGCAWVPQSALNDWDPKLLTKC